jgi:hypothetical protein
MRYYRWHWLPCTRQQNLRVIVNLSTGNHCKDKVAASSILGMRIRDFVPTVCRWGGDTWFLILHSRQPHVVAGRKWLCCLPARTVSPFKRISADFQNPLREMCPVASLETARAFRLLNFHTNLSCFGELPFHLLVRGLYTLRFETSFSCLLSNRLVCHFTFLLSYQSR